ncbi:uncharacterized protein [Panulirus ornatus]
MAQQTPGWMWAYVVVVVVGARWASGVCVAVGESNVYKMEGDAVITLLLPLHHGQHCEQLGLSEVQILEATKMAVQKVNHLGLVPNVTLGLRAVDTCGDPNFSVKVALASWASDALACPQSAFSLGFLGPGDVASASAVGDATQSLGTPVVAYSPRPAVAPNTIDLLIPAPQRSVQAAVHVLSGAGVDAISIVHTADTEGETLSKHFITAAEYIYICVEMVLEDGDNVGVAEVLREGPGTIVILGTRHKVQSLARVLGGADGPADLLLLVESAGPVPQVELAGLEVPALLLKRTVPTLPEFISFLGRDLESDDEPRLQYLAAVSECELCTDTNFGYDTNVPAAVAAVLVYVEALREMQSLHCGSEGGLCHNMKGLEASAWSDIMASASLQTVAKATFPSLLKSDFIPGSEDMPRYTVKVLMDGNITQVGQADESSAVLGELLVSQPKCGTHCPCTFPTLPPELPTASNITDTSSGFDIMSGSEWWNFDWPVGFQQNDNMSRGEMATYLTAFAFITIIFLCSSMVCAFRLNRPPRRD